MGDGLFGDIIIPIILLLLVFLAAYYTTRFLSVKTWGTARGKYMKLKDSMLIGRDKQLILLEVGDKEFLIGATAQSVNLIGTLEKDSIIPVAEDKQAPSAISNFREFLSKAQDSAQRKATAPRELRNARAAAKRSKHEAEVQATEIPEDADEIDQLLAAVSQRKRRVAKPQKETEK